MIRRENIPTIRTLLLTCMLGITLSACANDGRLDLKKLDFSRLKQPDWLRWDKDDKASKTSPQSVATQADTAAKPTRAKAPATAVVALIGSLNVRVTCMPAVFAVAELSVGGVVSTTTA